MYEIVDYTPPPTHKWGDVERLGEGQAFLVPWPDLEMYKHPQSIMRTIAALYGKRLGRKFGTRKTAEGVWIYRVAAVACLVLLTMGQSFAQSIPYPAMAARFNTLAFWSPFSDPYYANLSNWLDCAGASNPQYWISGNVNPPPPCSRVSIIQDETDGLPALQLLFTADDAYNGGTALTSVCANGGYVCGVDFSNGVYIQVTMRIDPQSMCSNPWGAWIGGAYTWSNSYQLSRSNASFEQDVYEGYANACGAQQYGDSIVKGYLPGYVMQYLILDGYSYQYLIDQTQWFTIGMQTMQNGSDLQTCMYVAQGYSVSQSDFVRCQSLSGAGQPSISQDELNARNYLILQAGNSYNPVQTAMRMLVRDVQVWTCWPTASGPDAFGVAGRTCENL